MNPDPDPLLRKGGSQDPDPRQNKMNPKRCFPFIPLVRLVPSHLQHVQRLKVFRFFKVYFCYGLPVDKFDLVVKHSQRALVIGNHALTVTTHYLQNKFQRIYLSL